EALSEVPLTLPRRASEGTQAPRASDGTPAPRASAETSPPWPLGLVAGPPPVSTGRRLALARWICDRQNPLAARVAVNHVWARHFGRPLAENVADFGVRTRPPAQQPLLDWLAVEFMDHEWSMKWLHRLLVTSAAYRMRSSSPVAPAANLAA